MKAPRVQDNRNLDALVAIKPKRTSRPVSVIAGTFVGLAASADSIEVCSGRGGCLARQTVEAGKPFSIRIPKTSSDDIAVVGFDDSLLSQTHRPAITTVRQDIIGLGAAAAETMIALLQDREPVIDFLPTEIMIRETA